MHPYLAQGVAEERIADFIRAAEANRKAREGAQPRGRRIGSRRRHSAVSQPSQTPARLVLAYRGSAHANYEQDRSAELCEASR